MTSWDYRAQSGSILETIRSVIDGRFTLKVDSIEALGHHLQELVLEPEPESGILWAVMSPRGRPSFTLRMIHDFLVFFAGLESLPAEVVAPYRVVAYRSAVPGVFNRGGDLPLFLECIAARDEEVLRTYAQGCALMSFRNRNFPMQPLVSVALIQGDALGGGFEAALSCDVLFAESSAQFGFPEVLFNLFPGMGAVTYLTRRVGARAAERLILAGKHYPAGEMHELGAIDHVLPDGEGVAALRAFLGPKLRRYNAWSGFHRSRRLADPVSRAELSGIAEIWVERALSIDPMTLGRMQQLIRKQDALQGSGAQPRPEPRLLAAE